MNCSWPWSAIQSPEQLLLSHTLLTFATTFINLPSWSLKQVMFSNQPLAQRPTSQLNYRMKTLECGLLLNEFAQNTPRHWICYVWTVFKKYFYVICTLQTPILLRTRTVNVILETQFPWMFSTFASPSVLCTNTDLSFKSSLLSSSDIGLSEIFG